MMDKKRVIVVTESDKIWALPTWSATIPRLQEHYEVTDLWLVVPAAQQRKYKGSQKWFFKTMGALVFIKLALYAIKKILSNVFSNQSFKQIAKRYKLRLQHIPSVNDERFRAWLASQDLDYVVIMVNEIVDSKVLQSSSATFINKHASLLPSCKGIFPYIWAYLNKVPQAISFHIVDERIDHGNIVLQQLVPEKYSTSMLSFYKFVFSMYPEMLLMALHNLSNGIEVNHVTDKSSYFTYPSKEDMKLFYSMSGKVVRWKDLI